MKAALFLANASDQLKNGINQACTTSCNTVDIGVIFGNVANALIFVGGAVAVIMIILGGLRYITSNGDAKAAASGKDTIMYAVIGLVVAIAAYAIVNFVVVNIGTTPKAK